MVRETGEPGWSTVPAPGVWVSTVWRAEARLVAPLPTE